MAVAIKKYGPDAFKGEVIAHASNRKELGKLEEMFIKQFGTINPTKGYNVKHGSETRGEGHITGEKKMWLKIEKIMGDRFKAARNEMKGGTV